MEYKLDASQLRAYAPILRAGDRVILSGTVYTARDAAHKRIAAAIESGSKLPFELKDAVIYYAGPTPAPQGLAVGACGPTTSGRMDVFTPLLLDNGLAAMIGKPKAARAVGGALHHNPLLILVPCHRIIGSDGSLTGFAGGTDKKRFLLDLEQSNRK